MENSNKETDLYTILVLYSNKNNSPYIEIRTFLSFLGKYAQKMSAKNSAWLKWTKDLEKNFWIEMSALAEDNKCELLTDTAEDRIYMPHFFPARIRHYYKDIEKNANLPFPTEESIGFKIPESQVLSISVGSELISILEASEKSGPPIIRINFSEEYGTLLILAEFIPQRLTEACLLKARNYLKDRNNLEYVFNKMTPQLSGKTVQLRGILDQILAHPQECYSPILEGSDFSYLFWSHFGIFLKNDIKRKKDLTIDDIGAVQAVYIIETLNAHFRSLAAKEKEKDLAFKDLELQLKKPPYFFNLDEIIKFSNSQGTPLLNYYSNTQLESELKRLTTKEENAQLPDFLIIKENNENWFISKNRLLFICAKMIGDCREKIKNALSKRWIRLLEEYRKESAMNSERDFNDLLEQYTKRLSPFLTNILDDPRLFLIYEEMEKSGKDIPLAARVFSGGRLLQYSEIYQLQRKNLLYEAKLMLPFWFSVPFLVKIISFFKRSPKKRKAKAQQGGDTETEPEVMTGEKKKGNERAAAAREIEVSILPEGKTLEEYMKDLESRWARVIDKQARANLVEDVNSLVRDALRRTLRLQKSYKITHENLAELAENILTHAPSLQNTGEDDALTLYMELYLVKLLKIKN